MTEIHKIKKIMNVSDKNVTSRSNIYQAESDETGSGFAERCCMSHQ